MPHPMTIDLREGFQRTAVVIRVDGREVFRANDVTTRRQLGLARQVHVEGAGPTVVLEVELPSDGARVQQLLDTTGPCFVGVDIADGRPRLQVRAEPFGYV